MKSIKYFLFLILILFSSNVVGFVSNEEVTYLMSIYEYHNPSNGSDWVQGLHDHIYSDHNYQAMNIVLKGEQAFWNCVNCVILLYKIDQVCDTHDFEGFFADITSTKKRVQAIDLAIECFDMWDEDDSAVSLYRYLVDNDMLYEEVKNFGALQNKIEQLDKEGKLKVEGIAKNEAVQYPFVYLLREIKLTK